MTQRRRRRKKKKVKRGRKAEIDTAKAKGDRESQIEQETTWQSQRAA